MGGLLRYNAFINGAFFYIAWYAAIYGAALDFELLGSLIAFAFIALHFFLSSKRGKDLIFLALFLALSILGDYFLLSWKLIAYPSCHFDVTCLGIPLWILAIYASFSTTINHSMVFMHRYPIFSAFSSGLGGAFSYYLAEKMEVISLPFGELSLFAIGVYWFLIIALSKVMSDYLDKKQIKDSTGS
jgi:hypothetical protein